MTKRKGEAEGRDAAADVLEDAREAEAHPAAADPAGRAAEAAGTAAEAAGPAPESAGTAAEAAGAAAEAVATAAEAAGTAEEATATAAETAETAAQAAAEIAERAETAETAAETAAERAATEEQGAGARGNHGPGGGLMAFPDSLVKRIMKQDEEVNLITTEAVKLVSHCTGNVSLCRMLLSAPSTLEGAPRCAGCSHQHAPTAEVTPHQHRGYGACIPITQVRPHSAHRCCQHAAGNPGQLCFLDDVYSAT